MYYGVMLLIKQQISERIGSQRKQGWYCHMTYVWLVAAAAAAALHDLHIFPGGWLYGACRGVDSTAVVASGPPKTISVEDSFKSCSTWDGVKKVLQVGGNACMRVDIYATCSNHKA